MTETLKYIQFGLGPIGERVVKYGFDRGNLELESAIDIDPAKAGKDVGELIGNGRYGVKVRNDTENVLKNSAAKIVVLTTVSNLADLMDQINLCIKYGKNVVSSTEELAFPWSENVSLARKIDEQAKDAGVTVLGTGVNPGFLMDALPIFLTSACQQVDSIRIERHQDASIRRLPFQKKIGAGLSVKDFKKLVSEKIIRHVGFSESIQMIANSMGWELDRTVDIVEPVIAKKDVESQFLKVSKGQAAGVWQTGQGFINGNAVITLELQAYLGHPNPKDSVRIEGDPPIYSEIKGGVNGDIATCAMLVNAIPKVIAAAPGLKTIPDVGLVSWFRAYNHA
ncbi:dihydrodipicolinate reductase [Thermodesulfobacteriota bacterium]